MTSKAKILIVDDDPDIIELLSFHLEKEGFDVTAAHNGKEALEIAENTTQETHMPIVIDKERYVVIKEGKELILPRKEFELLALLMSKPGKVFDRNTILEQVWGTDVVIGDRTIDVHIRKLREKIGSNYIKTLKGVGYKFEIPQ
jgi:DNA-binding response OmpR family regulator